MTTLTPPICALDHIVLLCPDIKTGEAVYSAVLGRSADWRSTDPSGASSAIFQLNNMALELMAPSGEGPLNVRLNELIRSNGPGLQSLVFATEDIASAHHLFDRRALSPSEIQTGTSTHLDTGQTRSWRRLRLADNATHGIRMFTLQREPTDPLVCSPSPTGSLNGLDHVVINTADPDRAVALYAGRLGLHLALDRTNTDWGARLLFFRTGGLSIELAHRLGKPATAHATDRPDQFWGLCWRTGDIDQAHARMMDAGLSASDIRPGRKPGTRVFSLKDGTLNVPTLILSSDPATEAP